MNKRRFQILFASVFVALCAAFPAAAAQKSFHIIMINDPHSNILPTYEANEAGLDEKDVVVTRSGGLSRALYVALSQKEEILSENENAAVFLFEAGDVMLGKKGSAQGGRAEYGSLAAAGFDAGVLGNHDFDGGVKTLTELCETLKFPVLASNIIFDDARLNEKYKKSAVMEKAGVRVGVFGLVTPELKSLISDASGFDVETDIFKEARKRVAELSAQSVDAVVALTHIGLELDKRLAAEVPGIAVIVGGHSHDAVKDTIFVRNASNATIIGQAGLDGRYAGRFDVTTDDGSLVSEKSAWRLLPVTEGTPLEKRAEELGRRAQEELAAAFDIANPAIYFTKSFDATKDAVRTRESAVGDLTAEALRWYCNARIGMVNGGALRIFKIVPPGAFSASDMIDLLPFENSPVRLLVTGAEIRRQLEAAASSLVGVNDDFNPALRMSSGEFLQVAGLRFEIDASKKPSVVKGRRVIEPGSRVFNIAVESARGFEPIRDDAAYSVATIDFAAKYWDVLRADPSGIATINCIDKYFSDILRRLWTPETDGRIKIINARSDAL